MTDEELDRSPTPEMPAVKFDSLEETRRMLRWSLVSFLLSLFLTLVLAALASLPELSELLPTILPETIPSLEPLRRWNGQISTALATLLMIVHWRIYRHGLGKLLRLAPDDNSLIAASTLAAFLYSVIALALTDPDLVSGGPATWYVPLGITLTLTALGHYAFSRAGLYIRETLVATEALPVPDIPSHPVGSSLPGHIALFSLIAALISSIFWALLDSVSVASAVLFAIPIAVCPGALGITEALSVLVAIRKAQVNGLILRNRNTIEAAADTDTIVFGKTGLLTSGKPYITDLVPEGLTNQAFIGMAASAEAQSYHPIAEAIAGQAIRTHVRLQRLAAFNEIPGEGVEALISGSTVRVGTKEWLEREKIRISANLLTKFDQLTEKGKTVLFVSRGTEAKGLIAFQDDLRPEISDVLKSLLSMNIRPVLMTGDSQRMTKAFARQLCLEEFKAGIQAGDKTREIQILQAQGRNVALICKTDVNVPAARQADLTIVPSSGEPEIKCLADIVLTKEGIAALPLGLSLCRRTMETIRSNYIWAFAGPLLALPAASGLLYAFGGPLFAPWMASLASMPGLAVAFINAFRLRRL